MTKDAQGYEAVAYQNLVPVLVEAIKQQKEIDALRTEIAGLRDEQQQPK